MLEIFTLAGRQCCKATSNIQGKTAICIVYNFANNAYTIHLNCDIVLASAQLVWTNLYKAFVKRNSTVTLSKGIKLKFSCRIAYTLLTIRLLLLIAHSLKKPKFVNLTNRFLFRYIHLFMCHQHTYIGNCNKDTWSLTFYNCKVN